MKPIESKITFLGTGGGRVAISNQIRFSGGFVTGQVSNCMGVILSACGKHDLAVAFVYPSHVKKVITGNGRATKGQMKKYVKDMMYQLCGEHVKFDSEHSCDATANILCWLKENKKLGDVNDQA